MEEVVLAEAEVEGVAEEAEAGEASEEEVVVEETLAVDEEVLAVGEEEGAEEVCIHFDNYLFRKCSGVRLIKSII